MADRLWFKIGEAARQLGVSPKELRYWESVIPDIRPRRSKGNLRYYHLEELPRLERIRDWLREGLTVADCQQLLKTGQLRRGLGLELPAAPPEPPTERPVQAGPQPRLGEARAALAALLARLSTGPRPLVRPSRRRGARPAEPVPPPAKPEPVAPAPKPARPRRKPAEPSDPNDFGPLFSLDQGK